MTISESLNSETTGIVPDFNDQQQDQQDQKNTTLYVGGDEFELI